MSVHSLTDDLQFVQSFHQNVSDLVSTIKQWEDLDCLALDNRVQDPDPDSVGLSYENLMEFNKAREAFPQLRSKVNFEIVKIRNLARRYGLSFNENWLYRIPTSGRHGTTYTFSINEDMENSIFRGYNSYSRGD